MEPVEVQWNIPNESRQNAKMTLEIKSQYYEHEEIWIILVMLPRRRVLTILLLRRKLWRFRSQWPTTRLYFCKNPVVDSSTRRKTGRGTWRRTNSSEKKLQNTRRWRMGRTQHALSTGYCRVHVTGTKIAWIFPSAAIVTHEHLRARPSVCTSPVIACVGESTCTREHRMRNSL